MMPHASPQGPPLRAKVESLLVIGHPGHELRVLGWLGAARPLVAVITDGGGFHDDPRIHLTRDLVQRLGGRPAPLFGSVTDKAFYAALIGGDLGFFEALAERLADLMVTAGVGEVVGDAIEGYSPTHDVCRLVIDAAVARAAPRLDRPIANRAFRLTGVPGEGGETGGEAIRLSPQGVEAKLASVRAYAEAVGGTLLAEVEELLATHGAGALAVERLEPPRTEEALAEFAAAKPFYETYGEKKVAAGQYAQVLRFRDHVAPVAARLIGSA
jgi:hypothetical protein